MISQEKLGKERGKKLFWHSKLLHFLSLAQSFFFFIRAPCGNKGTRDHKSGKSHHNPEGIPRSLHTTPERKSGGSWARRGRGGNPLERDDKPSLSLKPIGQETIQTEQQLFSQDLYANNSRLADNDAQATDFSQGQKQAQERGRRSGEKLRTAGEGRRPSLGEGPPTTTSVGPRRAKAGRSPPAPSLSLPASLPWSGSREQATPPRSPWKPLPGRRGVACIGFPCSPARSRRGLQSYPSCWSDRPLSARTASRLSTPSLLPSFPAPRLLP